MFFWCGCSRPSTDEYVRPLWGDIGLIDCLELRLNGWIHNICSYEVRHLVLDQVGFLWTVRQDCSYRVPFPLEVPFHNLLLFNTLLYPIVFIVWSTHLLCEITSEWSIYSVLSDVWVPIDMYHLMHFKGTLSGYCSSYKSLQIWQLRGIPIIISQPLWVRSYDGLGQVHCYGPQKLKLMTAERASQLAGVKRSLQGCSHCGQSPVPLVCIDGLHVSWVAISHGCLFTLGNHPESLSLALHHLWINSAAGESPVFLPYLPKVLCLTGLLTWLDPCGNVDSLPF